MPTLCKCDLSVIIPVYNLENYIQPMLNSLKEQKLGDYKIEIIFVLNNCTDRSEEIIRESGLGLILTCEEQGCGCARNVGMANATGEYIWFMDGDDWLLKDTAIKDALDQVKDRDIFRILFQSDRYHMGYFSMVWQYLLKKSFIDEFRFRKIQPAEDDDFMRKVLTKAGYQTALYYNIPSTDRPLYYYNYMREGSNMWRVARGEDINAPRLT